MAGAHTNGSTNDWLVSEVDTARSAKAAISAGVEPAAAVETSPGVAAAAAAAAAAANDRMTRGVEGGVDESTQLDQVRERLKAVDLCRD